VQKGVFFLVTKIKARRKKDKKIANYSLRNKVSATSLLRRLSRPAGATREEKDKYQKKLQALP